MGKAMYQSAFLSFENCLNSVVARGALRDISKAGCEGDWVVIGCRNRLNVNKDSPITKPLV